LKICDLTQFYSPASGGVRRYVSEKVRFIREQSSDSEHILIVPGSRDEMLASERARTYFIESPLISRISLYRVLLRLEAIERIVETERPDMIECGDPYQVAWRAVRIGAAFGIPVVGFYHSHFPEAYLRLASRFVGCAVSELLIGISRLYIRALYNRFDRTIVPSPALAEILGQWDVRNVIHCDLGVDTRTFQPKPRQGENVRAELAIPDARTLLLYVGRLAQEKNTHTLFEAIRLLPRDRYHLVIVGDGLQRDQLDALKAERQAEVTHLPTSADLPALYRAADLFVHPGVQETFGLVTIEAQACGTPVVGIRGSPMDRIVHCDQADWARENTPAALARAIVATSGAKSRGQAMPLHAAIAARYSWEDVFTRLFDLYREVIHNRRQS
jgi:alpha-1,6-mannosyltransferase